MEKCRSHSRQSVWWPGLGQFMPSEFSERSWQKLAMDLFLLESKTYLSLIIEISQLSHTRSTNVIVHIKSIVDRYGIPEVLMSDNRAGV